MWGAPQIRTRPRRSELSLLCSDVSTSFGDPHFQVAEVEWGYD